MPSELDRRVSRGTTGELPSTEALAVLTTNHDLIISALENNHNLCKMTAKEFSRLHPEVVTTSEWPFYIRQFCEAFKHQAMLSKSIAEQLGRLNHLAKAQGATQ